MIHGILCIIDVIIDHKCCTSGVLGTPPESKGTASASDREGRREAIEGSYQKYSAVRTSYRDTTLQSRYISWATLQILKDRCTYNKSRGSMHAIGNDLQAIEYSYRRIAFGKGSLVWAWHTKGLMPYNRICLMGPNFPKMSYISSDEMLNGKFRT